MWVFISIFIYVSIVRNSYSLAFVFLHAGDKISFFSIGFTVLHTAGIHSRNSYVIHLHVSPLLQVHSASLRTSVVWFVGSRACHAHGHATRPSDGRLTATRTRRAAAPAPQPSTTCHAARAVRGVCAVSATVRTQRVSGVAVAGPRAVRARGSLAVARRPPRPGRAYLLL